MYWGLGVPVDRIGVVMGVSQDGSINGGPGLWNSLFSVLHQEGSSGTWVWVS